MKRYFTIIIALVVGIIGFILGREVERYRNDEAYVYPLSLYSNHLHMLVADQKIRELTNDIISFDVKFAETRAIDYVTLVKILNNSETNK